ncbi:MAG: class I SAM-dependent methyltransferase [Oligoflexia bacterium]|nr:class I SAM-dependent methyltransferase [Oligoflexia bacterium]MBF0367291.1 class I SAM-dependent methyltransferase [Oligoflexia bacterium]
MKKSEKYGVGKLIHHWKYYDALNTFTDDIPFYLELSKKVKGSILELCCGTGRVTIPIAKAGVNITGADFTTSMLVAAKRKAKKENLEVTFIKQDMRKLSLNKKFNLIFIPFNSLQNTYTLHDMEKIFQSIKKHLSSEGIFAFDIFNPSIHLIVELEKKKRKIGKMVLENGTKVTLSESCKYDSAAQVSRIT